MARKPAMGWEGKMQLDPRQLSDEQAERFGVPPGWWALTDDGQPVPGPYPSRESTLIGIAAHGTAGPEPEVSAQPGRSAPRTDESSSGS